MIFVRALTPPYHFTFRWLALAVVGLGLPLFAFAEPIPRRQSRPPGPPLSPAAALDKMTVPEGFSVELVACEPDVVNPIAMAFDERGRVWITESLEYPRKAAGPGRDRIKIIEDTDGDGRADKSTIFADGLNIPSGIAVGYGGVWVANAPDILLLQDTDGDDRADKRTVVVTGFGREDTHELPNSLTWGPDGWLYGLNGVFNPSRIEHQGKVHEFTCAMFRLHPRTHAFEVFCQGTSNPWGIAFDSEGSAFVSACVIDHLWHFAEGACYQRQSGPNPPLSAVCGSIVEHKHQLAAYCGIVYFDSDAYPEEYRRHLYMGNIHGGCINVDSIARRGASYFALPRDDFFTANDVWFMPVSQKVGPDGCLYLLDWYDRYHCYQDAGRDPEGVDRARGRLYRIRYGQTPRPQPTDLGKTSDADLIQDLGHPSIYRRETAQRLLTERANPTTKLALNELVANALEIPLDQLAKDVDRRRTQALQALWTLVSIGELDEALHLKLLKHADSTICAWGVRAAGNQGRVSSDINEMLNALAIQAPPDVRLQIVIAAPKLLAVDEALSLIENASCEPTDRLLLSVAWNRVRDLVGKDVAKLHALFDRADFRTHPLLANYVSKVCELTLAQSGEDLQLVDDLLSLALRKAAHGTSGEQAASEVIDYLAGEIQAGKFRGRKLRELQTRLSPKIADFIHNSPASAIQDQLLLLAANWGETKALADLQAVFSDRANSESRRLAALRALIARDVPAVAELLTDEFQNIDEDRSPFYAELLAALDRVEADWPGEMIVATFPKLPTELQPRAVELLTTRVSWAAALLAAVERQDISQHAINANQLRKMLLLKNADLANRAQAIWGSVRLQRNRDREQVVAQIREVLQKTTGDPHRGQQVFNKVCAQCHKIHGEGIELGPDLTLNGRASFEQLLSNVLDPSLVIGPAYQARTVITDDGRVLTGLIAADSQERIVLKIQGGKQEVIPRDQIEEMQVGELSLMPEGLEKQLTPQELADLFAFLRLDKHPSDPAANFIPDKQ